LKKQVLLAAVLVCMLFSVSAFAQLDFLGGVSGVASAGSSNPISVNYKQSLAGGVYPSIAGDYIFKNHNLGFGGEYTVRATQNLYRGFQPFRPQYYDVNLIWAPPINKNLVGEVQGGFGAQRVKFSTDVKNCTVVIGCITYDTATHFMGHVGGGVRWYLKGNLFVRPEAHLYLVQGASNFSSGVVFRYGISLGYSFLRLTD